MQKKNKKRKWFDSEKLDDKATRVYEELEEEAIELMRERKNGRNQ